MKKRILTALISLSLAASFCLLSSCTSSEKDNSESSVQESEKSEASVVSVSDESSVSKAEELTEAEEFGKKVQDYFKEYLSINNEFTYKTGVTFGMSSEGASVRGYYHNDKIKLLKVRAYGELGKNYWDFYVVDENTLFVALTEYEYSTSISLGDPDEIYIAKEYLELYAVSNGKAYKYDLEKIEFGEETERDIKGVFDDTIKYINSSDFVDDPTIW